MGPAPATSGLYPHLEVKRLVEGRWEIVGVFREPESLGAVVLAVYIPFMIESQEEERAVGRSCAFREQKTIHT